MATETHSQPLPRMESLPVELLSSIFTYVLPDYTVHTMVGSYQKRLKALSILSRVNRDWNFICLSTPNLWSLVEIGFNARASHRVRRCLAHAGARPLDIVIYDYTTRKRDPDFVEAKGLLLNRSHRWHSVFLYTNASSDCILSQLPSILPNTTSFKLVLPMFLGSTPEPCTSSSPIIAPKLTYFASNMASYVELFEVSTLKHCAISTSSRAGLTDMPAMLNPQSFQNLERLELGPDVRWTWDPARRHAEMPNLKELCFLRFRVSAVLEFICGIKAQTLALIQVQDLYRGNSWFEGVVYNIAPCLIQAIKSGPRELRELVCSLARAEEWRVQMGAVNGILANAIQHDYEDLQWLQETTTFSWSTDRGRIAEAWRVQP